MEYTRGRYSWLLRPTLILYDLSIINISVFFLFNFNDENLTFFLSDFLNNKHVLFAIYSITFWLSTTFLLKFYKVYRYTSLLNIISLLAKQFLVYSIIVFAFIGAFRSININVFKVLAYITYAFFAIGTVKIFSFLILKSVRLYLRGNLRNVILIGSIESTNELKKVFINKKQLGYKLKASFNDLSDINRSKTITNSFKFLNTNVIDEIYCSVDELTEIEVNEYVKYANTNHCNIKFIPKNNKIFSKRFRIDYYNYLPVLSIQEGAINDEFNKFIKRVFDIIFSLLIIIFLLSWLSVLLFIIIKLDSKGPLFYKHKRNGINYKEFYCFKYRSLSVTNEKKGTYVKPEDPRVTKIGKFLRKTSIDELPQFINVLLGDMSVVGPRPHMLSYTNEYSKKIDMYNFIYRHHVKPGVTGLAQVSGFRGEIETDKDIIGRIEYDIFYIENWSILLDIKIIFQTIKKIIVGDNKAY